MNCSGEGFLVMKLAWLSLQRCWAAESMATRMKTMSNIALGGHEISKRTEDDQVRIENSAREASERSQTPVDHAAEVRSCRADFELTRSATPIKRVRRLPGRGDPAMSPRFGEL